MVGCNRFHEVPMRKSVLTFVAVLAAFSPASLSCAQQLAQTPPMGWDALRGDEWILVHSTP